MLFVAGAGGFQDHVWERHDLQQTRDHLPQSSSETVTLRDEDPEPGMKLEGLGKKDSWIVLLLLQIVHSEYYYYYRNTFTVNTVKIWSVKVQCIKLVDIQWCS